MNLINKNYVRVYVRACACVCVCVKKQKFYWNRGTFNRAQHVITNSLYTHIHMNGVRWRMEWRVAWKARRGDNARTITMTERATVYSGLLIREFRFAVCAPFRKLHDHVVCTLIRDPRLPPLPSLHASQNRVTFLFINRIVHLVSL